ncbi:MAG: proline--tRNA ligase [Euryarchaeota archaeon]|nr:proline--tRNA ligase [Euryarchaeota archaeon]
MRERWKENFSEWYSEVIERAEILDVRYPVKGVYVWRPYGFKIRSRVVELIRRILDATGHEEALFPLLIPEHEFAKEAKHIAGFEDEVYWVTHGGLTELKVKLALRPTSETAIYPIFALWIRSHADMPLKIYQVVNTFRYETKHTRPLIRLREITTFKEAHTAHASAEDAERQVQEAIACYKRFFDALGVPYIVSRRPDWDKFPGAEYTVAFDTIFPDGRTLQIATVHNLGQNFSRTFEITFENPQGEQEYAYQTCYGISDRVIAALLALHGDDSGLCLMPEVAPIQVVVVPIWFKDKKELVDSEVEKLKEELRDFRVHVDARDIRPGAKYYDWELKGVPLRVELGPRDIEQGRVTLVRRDTGERFSVPRSEVRERVRETLEEISSWLRERARREMEGRIHSAQSIEEIRSQVVEKGGVVRTTWCGREACGKGIEDSADVDILGILEEEAQGTCVGCGERAERVIIMGRSY